MGSRLCSWHSFRDARCPRRPGGDGLARLCQRLRVTVRVTPMCFDHDSLPPIPVIRGAAVSHDDLVLEAGDGNRFAAFVAEPDESAGVGFVVLPDVRGLYRFYEELA